MNRHSSSLPVLLGALAIGAGALINASCARASDPDALWKIVHGQCAPNMQAKGDPAPCVAVDLAGGTAVLKDIRGPRQLLLIPTDRITGIEDPAVLAPRAPNYFEAAWTARGLFEQRAGRPVPRDDLALAVNSMYGRSQNQLHIHIDCVRADIKQTLAADAGSIGKQWADLPLVGHHYRARRIDGADLAGANPFDLLADGDPAARADMSHETLVAIGEVFGAGHPGFILLSDRADAAAGDSGSGEELMDHGCAVLGDAGPTPAPATAPLANSAH